MQREEVIQNDEIQERKPSKSHYASIRKSPAGGAFFEKATAAER